MSHEEFLHYRFQVTASTRVQEGGAAQTVPGIDVPPSPQQMAHHLSLTPVAGRPECHDARIYS